MNDRKSAMKDRKSAMTALRDRRSVKRERRIDAYRDGALGARERARLEAEFAGDPEASARLRQTEALGGLVREAWSEGPSAPAPEYLIAELRPRLAEVDRELASQGWGARLLDALTEAIRPVPSAALAGVAALLLLYLAPTPSKPVPTATSSAATLSLFRAPPETPIYDLAQGENPIMIYEADDGATIIWILDDADEVSFLEPLEAAAEGRS